jgi:hypothetical protein
MSHLEEDYLEEDKPLKGQSFACLSFLTHLSFPEEKRSQYKDQKMVGVKVRGVYKSFEEADARAKQLQKIDKRHHVFVGEVGKWLPFDADTSNMEPEQQVYREQQLNQYMKTYYDTLKEDDELEAVRKEEMLKGANVVTGKHDAPESTGLGSGFLEDRKLPKPQQVETQKYEEGVDVELDDVKKSQDVASTTADDPELGKVLEQKNKIVCELEESKKSLSELEDKMATINQIYKQLQQ